MNATKFSILVKAGGVFIAIVALALNGFGIWDIAMSEVCITVTLMYTAVLPIDISKIKVAQSHTNQK